VRALIDGFAASRARIVRLRYADGPGPSLLSREIFAEAGHLHGDVGARILIASHPDWVHDVEIARNAPRDIDTPADLGAAVRAGRSAGRPMRILRADVDWSSGQMQTSYVAPRIKE
jgi:molybdenum cofactor cytidylyltransferase